MSINDAFELFLFGVWRTYYSKKLEFLAALFLLGFCSASELSPSCFNQTVAWSYVHTIGSSRMHLTLALIWLILHFEI